MKLLPWEVAHTFMWQQMMWTFHRFGYESTPPAWVFIGQQPATMVAIVIIMVIRIGRDPHRPWSA